MLFRFCAYGFLKNQRYFEPFLILIFAFANDFGWLLCAMIVYGVGDTFRTGTHKAMIFEWLRLQNREAERTKFYGLTRSWSKIGSAVSSLLAGAYVLITEDYRAIFLLAIVPYVFNIINFTRFDASQFARPPALLANRSKSDFLFHFWSWHQCWILYRSLTGVASEADTKQRTWALFGNSKRTFVCIPATLGFAISAHSPGV